MFDFKDGETLISPDGDRLTHNKRLTYEICYDGYDPNDLIRVDYPLHIKVPNELASKTLQTEAIHHGFRWISRRSKKILSDVPGITLCGKPSSFMSKKFAVYSPMSMCIWDGPYMREWYKDHKQILGYMKYYQSIQKLNDWSKPRPCPWIKKWRDGFRLYCNEGMNPDYRGPTGDELGLENTDVSLILLDYLETLMDELEESR